MGVLTLPLLGSLLAGLAGGVACPPWTTEPAQAAFAGALMAAALAHARGWRRGRDALGWTMVACVAWIVGVHAVDRAEHPSLRTVLEDRFGGFAMRVDGGVDGGVGEERLEDSLQLEGRLRQDASPGSVGIVLRLAAERVWVDGRPRTVDGGVVLVVSGELAGPAAGAWTEGRRLRVLARLRRPARYLDDGVPDLERGLARRGVALVGAVKSAALVEVRARGRPWQEWAARVRAHVRRRLAARLSGGGAGAAAVATALLLGDRAALGADVTRRLQEAGTYHVLAISGGNIAILAGTVLGGLALAGWRGRGAAAAAIAMLAAYALVVEGGASVLRALGMAALYLAIRFVDQRTPPVNALALVVIALVIAEPLAILDVGLWLTCGATLGILLGAERLAGVAPVRVRAAAAVVASTLAAEAVLLPVGARVFQRVTLAGVALNLVAIPCMTAAQLAAMALLGCDALGVEPAARAAARITEWGVAGLLGSAALVDRAPWLTWRVPPPSPWIVAAYYAAAAAWWLVARAVVDTPGRRRLVRLGGVATGVLLVWIASDPPTLARALGDGRLHLTMVDVGQGDCVLVTYPNGRRLLVDTGGTAGGDFDVGDRIVGPALRARGVRRLDYLAITHGDVDHLGGAAAVLRDFAPAEIWLGIPVAGHGPTARLHAAAAAARAAWRPLQRGDRLEIGGVITEVLHPPLPDWERQRVRNDDSLVLALRLGDVALVLTGDIGAAAEDELAAAWTPAPRVVLKVPHHGSAASSGPALLGALAPALAVIGVGRGNPYGHPAAAVLDRYARAGTVVFRTDRDGEVDVSTDGRAIDARTFTGRTARWP